MIQLKKTTSEPSKIHHEESEAPKINHIYFMIQILGLAVPKYLLSECLDFGSFM